jgi:hypothetical protein
MALSWIILQEAIWFSSIRNYIGGLSSRSIGKISPKGRCIRFLSRRGSSWILISLSVFILGWAKSRVPDLCLPRPRFNRPIPAAGQVDFYTPNLDNGRQNRRKGRKSTCPSQAAGGWGSGAWEVARSKVSTAIVADIWKK